MQSNQLNFFDILRNILQKTDPNMQEKPGFKEAFSPYMLIRYLSMKPELLPFAVILQNLVKARTLNYLQIYKFAYNNIPRSNPYIKYIKSRKKKENATA